MREFFSIEGPFNKYGGMLADMVLVSFMWVLFSLPVITAGASTTAMFYVTTRRISEREGYITTDFWQAFKANFRRATVIWMTLLLANAILLINILGLTNPESDIFAMEGSGILLAGQLLILAVVGLLSIYVFPLIARFDMKLKEIIKSAFFMGVRHFLTSMGCAVLAGTAVVVFLRFPPLIVLLPGAYAWLASRMIMKIFRRYRPEMDKDPALEIAEIEAKKAEERRKREPREDNE